MIYGDSRLSFDQVICFIIFFIIFKLMYIHSVLLTKHILVITVGNIISKTFCHVAENNISKSYVPLFLNV